MVNTSSQRFTDSYIVFQLDTGYAPLISVTVPSTVERRCCGWLFCQQFEFSWRKDIRPKRRSVCLDASQSVPGAPVILFACHGMHGNQRFKYNLVSGLLFCDPWRRVRMDGCSGSVFPGVLSVGMFRRDVPRNFFRWGVPVECSVAPCLQRYSRIVFHGVLSAEMFWYNVPWRFFHIYSDT